jgi:hypothetical protein
MTDNSSKAKDVAAGYKGHRPGSRKGTIHQLFEEQGVETAWTRGIKLRLKESTLRTWFHRWGAPAKAKGPSKPAAKAKAPKPAKVVKVKPEAKPDSGAATAAA